MITQDMTQKEAMSKYEWVEPVPFTNETAVEAAEIYVELRDDGEIIDKRDIYIAGAARSLGVSLVVGDNQFGSIDGLEVKTYRE